MEYVHSEKQTPKLTRELHTLTHATHVIMKIPVHLKLLKYHPVLTIALSHQHCLSLAIPIVLMGNTGYNIFLGVLPKDTQQQQRATV